MQKTIFYILGPRKNLKYRGQLKTVKRDKTVIAENIIILVCKRNNSDTRIRNSKVLKLKCTEIFLERNFSLRLSFPPRKGILRPELAYNVKPKNICERV